MNISKELTTLQCKGGRTKIAEDGVQITGSVSNLIDFTHVLGAKELITKLRDGVEAIIRFGMDDSSGDYYEFKGILSSADLQAPDSGGFAALVSFRRHLRACSWATNEAGRDRHSRSNVR